MKSAPSVSVVMSVFNGGKRLSETLDSVLCQAGCDFEFIVVNDGSTDSTPMLLDEYARIYPMLHVIHQPNSGLTNALILGCTEARGKYIARQDAGDISLPGRLAMQAGFLDEHPDAVMTACAVQMSGPVGEPLQVISKTMRILDAGIRQLDIKLIHGPQHGATMFRTEIYKSVGGYRQPFVVAQDIDLWLRMSERGLCLGMPDLLYEARIEVGSISSRRRVEQMRLGGLAIACAKRRRGGDNEENLLKTYIPAAVKAGPAGRHERAKFHYFIASCLRENNHSGAKRYYRQALKDNPFHLKALFRLITS